MASGGAKSVVSILLIVNLALYFIILVIASWAVNHGIELSREQASVLTIPARIFPIYFPIGNLATGFFIILSLLAGIFGVTTSLTGFSNILRWDPPSLHTAASSSLATWSITLLAMGLASKEIDLGWGGSNLRTLEIITIIASATQMVCTIALHAGVEEAVAEQKARRGRV